jgi:putative DNA primase/helicase
VKIVSVTAEEVQPERVRWLWDARIPIDLLSILAGPPGLGKTQLLIGMIARVTTGTLPGELHGRPAPVPYISAEDSIEHTLVPRFLAAGGDSRLAHFYRHKANSTRNGDETSTAINLPNDIPLIEQWLGDIGARIAVFDPIVAFIPHELNAHRDQHVRRVLAPIAAMSDKLRMASVLVMHLNKSTEGVDALNRLSGSIGFGGAARSVLLFAHDPNDPSGETGNQRVLAHVKCNVGPRAESLAYRIEPRTINTVSGDFETSVAMRVGNAAVSANDLLGKVAGSSEASARSEARDFLLAELADEPVPTKHLKTRAQESGLSWPTVERAKSQLPIKARKIGVSWVWELQDHHLFPNNPLDVVDVLDGVGSRKAIKTINSEGKRHVDGVDHTPLNALVADVDDDSDVGVLVDRLTAEPVI